MPSNSPALACNCCSTRCWRSKRFVSRWRPSIERDSLAFFRALSASTRRSRKARGVGLYPSDCFRSRSRRSAAAAAARSRATFTVRSPRRTWRSRSPRAARKPERAASASAWNGDDRSCDSRPANGQLSRSGFSTSGLLKVVEFVTFRGSGISIPDARLPSKRSLRRGLSLNTLLVRGRPSSLIPGPPFDGQPEPASITIGTRIRVTPRDAAMITIELFGVPRLRAGVPLVRLEAADVGSALRGLATACPALDGLGPARRPRPPGLQAQPQRRPVRHRARDRR